MTLHAQGDFQGTIKAIEYEKDGQIAEGLVLCFDIELEDGHQVIAKHRTHGPFAHICKNIIETLGLVWPHGIMKLGETIGTVVPVRIKHKPNKAGTQTFENAYVNFGGGSNAPAAPDFVKQAVEAMSASDIDDSTPF